MKKRNYYVVCAETVDELAKHVGQLLDGKPNLIPCGGTISHQDGSFSQTFVDPLRRRFIDLYVTSLLIMFLSGTAGAGYGVLMWALSR